MKIGKDECAGIRSSVEDCQISCGQVANEVFGVEAEGTKPLRTELGHLADRYGELLEKHAEMLKQNSDLKSAQAVLTQKCENLLTELVSVQRARGETEATLKSMKGSVAVTEALRTEMTELKGSIAMTEALRTEMAEVKLKTSVHVTKECVWHVPL